MSRYVSVCEVIEINAEVVRKFGGIHGLRDVAGLQSAVGRLERGYYSDPIEEAAAVFAKPSFSRWDQASFCGSMVTGFVR